MRKMYHKVCIAVLLIGLFLSSCDENNLDDFVDVVPDTKATTKTETYEDISETVEPIRIDLPETTTTKEKNTETATITATTTEATTTTEKITTTTEDTTLPVTTDSSATIPTVASNYMDTTVPEPNMSIVDEVTTKSNPETQIYDPSLLTYDKYSDGPYIFEDPIPNPYYYDHYSDSLKELYDLVYDTIDNHIETEVIIPTGLDVTAEDYEKIYEMIYNDEYRLYGINTTFQYMENSRTGRLYSFSVSYNFTKSEITKMRQDVDSEVDKIISGISPDMTKYDIVKYFYDEIAQKCMYDSEAPNLRNIYGVFVEKRAVCGGMAKAFSYLCDKVGIKSLTITGDDGDVPHLWNMVELGGEWYHIDPTNGVATSNGKLVPRYDYFCVTDATINPYRTVYPVDYSYPVANATKYNYFYYNDLIIDDTSSSDEVYDYIANLIVNASKNQDSAIAFSANNKENYDRINELLFESYSYNLIDLIYENQTNFTYRINTNSVNYLQNDKTYTITIIAQYL